MASLIADAQYDLVADVTVVELIGVLSMATAPDALKTVTKCLVECPSAVVVDLRQVEVVDSLALTAFWAAASRQRALPPVAVVLCMTPQTMSAELARASVGALSVADSIEAALRLAATTRGAMRRATLTLPGTPADARRARDFVTATCAAWDTERVVHEACLVASELVTNAVQHATSTIEFELVSRGPYLHVRVHDASLGMPCLQPPAGTPDNAARGRGLRLVDIYSSAWGCFRGPHGKVVWATLRAQPVGTRSFGPAVHD